ncbi:related to NADPH-ferrihemoprotein reductase and mammalian nitric-oxide synthases [Phialocephala subalpina]|uniref:NADPH-dependent diflavin oxidoreductase 1 n=1 Tax=Phialocephala subalpina TaxID=576137 RepID=A0A1L7XKX8_9HELO|nr:related to NADPH-ferrihemoprotein reductase and mammalian nitric-oxide synthases [Phialocephala subalpina]
MTQDVNGQRHDRTALILFGSETGNGQDVAEELGRVAERLHFMTRVYEMDEVELNILPRFTIVIFVTSTTGQGEFPRNAQKFWKSLLRKRLPPNCLGHVHFTTFGLGDSSYAQFNYAARKLHKRLEQLGAKEVYPRGEADERHDEGIDGTFLAWSADFQKHLLSSYPLPEGVIPIPSHVLLPPNFLLGLREDSTPTSNFQDSTSISISKESNHVAPSQPQDHGTNANRPLPLKGPIEQTTSTPALSASDPKMKYEPEEEPAAPVVPACPMLKEPHNEEPESIASPLYLPSAKTLQIPNGVPARLVDNKRVTPENHWQDVRLLTFIIEEGYDYYAGDTVTIYPKNFPADVEAVIELMGWTEIAHKPLTFNNGNQRNYAAPMAMNNVPEEFHHVKDCTLRDLLTHNLDITAIPKRYFFELAANHCNDETHELRLREFASPAYTDEYYDYATRPRRSILEVLHDFPSVKFPFEWALAVFPTIRGRAYSICSAGDIKYGEKAGYLRLQILVALVKYRTVLKKIRQGLCSRYLDSLAPGTTITTTMSITKMQSPWVLNSEHEDHVHHPIICIAPGTGIAPCRALIWSRAAEEYGRRGRINDLKKPVGKSYVFFGGRNRQADFFFEKDYTDPFINTQVFTAFSRDQKEKRYVQDVLRENGQMVEHLIMNEGARIFVCGSSGAMPKAVREAFVDTIQKWDKEKRNRKYAEAVVADLEKFKRYTQETW